MYCQFIKACPYKYKKFRRHFGRPKSLLPPLCNGMSAVECALASVSPVSIIASLHLYV